MSIQKEIVVSPINHLRLPNDEKFLAKLTIAASPRKQPARNAWGRDSPNPLTGRTNNAANGAPTHGRAAATTKGPAPAAKDAAGQDKQANDRFMFLIVNFVVSANIALSSLLATNPLSLYSPSFAQHT